MSKQREYLVALQASTIDHIWIKAGSEDEACRTTVNLWSNADMDEFVPKGGDIESVTVLEVREVRS